ncbi:uncharacterized protein LOC110990884 isoform X2 [Acanthaster planci]|uniref:Uncharacterized protein LOC110990884 isoform X2 n=1 Tax=Acanthaster planci TaxID=133434 RepID=A0A8B8A6P1_ACAPL|nr:uncharacterized protein LOC110990884 isoform X2 [Acanthaster planci]XP_022111660.1 uncharacterized protein LOC110990884 isoform X2 [Acanthaster planci]XP_022111661.1 uncharacterized protein LOC110990884 isoform X2 [Acanthaster planci]
MKHLVILLTLLACIGTIQALKCYACNYTNAVPTYNSFCDVNFNKNGFGAVASIVECDGVCVKASGGLGGLVGVERKCDTSENPYCPNACGSVQGTTIGGCRHCCKEDLCNGATLVTFNLLTPVAMLVSAWLGY